MKTDDIVRSVGRIQTIQNNRPRWISFGMGKVIDVGREGVTVTPIGMQAVLLCRPDDLEVVEPTLEQTPASKASGELQAESNKPLPDFERGGVVPSGSGTVKLEQGTVVSTPAGSIDVSGDVAEEQEQPKPKPRARRKKTTDAEEETSKKKKLPPPRRRRRDR